MVALPLFKLGALAIRQVTKPLVASVVRYSAEHERFRGVCIVLGRISYGLSGAYEEAARTEQQATDASASEAEGAAGGDQQQAPASSSPSSTESSAAAGDGGGGGSSSRRTFGSSARNVMLRPIDTAKEAYNRRFRAPIPQKLLIDAGAFVIVELTVYFVAAGILLMEYRSSSATSAEKERVQNERIAELERKVNELAEHQKLAGLRPPPKALRGWFSTITGSWTSDEEKAQVGVEKEEEAQRTRPENTSLSSQPAMTTSLHPEGPHAERPSGSHQNHISSK